MRLAFVAVAGCLLVSGCGGGGPSQRVLNDPRGSPTITLQRDQKLLVTFPVNHGVGSDWVIGTKPSAGVVRYEGSSYDPDQPQLPGSGGRQRFSFKARAKGTARIVFLNYFRGKVMQRRVLTVTVS